MKKDAKKTLNWQEIGQRFRDLRTGNNHSLNTIALIAQQSVGALGNFERGETPVSINYALFLRNEFGASFDWLYDGVEIDRAYEDVHKKRVFDPLAIGERLKAIREEKGMTQSEFGKLVGTTHANISRYESGVQKPEIKTALKIKRALNKPLDWLYFGDEAIIPKGKMRSKYLQRATATQLNSTQLSVGSKRKSRKL
ncbi:helix-turn-helix domain-containing protein [Candidatus Liberibacter asiaticus]|uniref:helix-turn-helix domain-containing protein n=1 Tax=Liberibacter asiaticus TaxID=34021 RepID=UPI004057E8D5